MAVADGPWRLRCPNGHSSYTTSGAKYYCQQCGEYFDEPVDAKELE